MLKSKTEEYDSPFFEVNNTIGVNIRNKPNNAIANPRP